MSTPPLDIEKLSIHENNSPTNLSFIENSDHNGIVGAKPVIIDNKLSISKYGDNINVFLAPLTNHHYKYNIRNKYINYINNDTSIIENKNDNFSIHKPALQESIDFSSIDTSNCKIIGLLSSWIDLGTKDALINKISFNIISNEILIAHYNHITNVVISPPKNVNNISNYCEILIKLLKFIKQNNLNITISISLPIITTDDLDYLSTWELWLKIKTLCNNNPNLNISLALLQSYSSENLDFLNKWVFEPVGSLLLSSSIFLPNKFKQPVLNKLNQLIVKKFQSQTGNDFKILLHGLEKYPDHEVTYIEYMNYITQKISKQLKQDTSNNNINNCFTESKNKEILYSELHSHIEQAFQTKLKTLLKLNKDAIHILVVKPDFDGSIIKTILKNILEMNQNNKDTNIIITVMEDNFINFNKITYLNKNKWGNILNLVDSLEQICQAVDIAITDNISDLNIQHYFNKLKLLFFNVEIKTEYIPDEILFKVKPIYKKEAIKEALVIHTDKSDYISLTKEKEYNNGQTLIYKINKKQQYNAIVLTLNYRINNCDIKVMKYGLPVDYHYLCKDSELELNMSINFSLQSDSKKTEINYTSSCYIYLINEQYTSIPNNTYQQNQKIDSKKSEGPMFDISSKSEQQMEFHERCMIWCERLYSVKV